MEYVLDFPIMFWLNEIEEEYKKTLNYIDVTDEWLKEAKPNSYSVKDLNYWIINGKKHYVDGKNIVLDYSKSEKECADWLENTFGGKIYMCPRVNNPDKIETPDYIFRKENWELKSPIGISRNVIDNQIKGKSKQSSNFIIDVTNNMLPIEELLIQVQKIYSSLRRNWVDKIIVKNGTNVVCIYQRKNEATETQMGHDRSH